MSDWHLFTSESVSPGHPDKMADIISDSILDAMLSLDPDARVACETLVKSNLVVVAGEVGSANCEDIVSLACVEQVVRRTIRQIGYDDPAMGFDADSCMIFLAINEQSSDIAKGIKVDKSEHNEKSQGAGDQGLMFGYATNETDVLMPAPITYAHLLMRRQAEVRCNGTLPWLRPDAKSQVTFRYDEKNQMHGVDTVVLSTQHTEAVTSKDIQSAVLEEIIKPVLGEHLLPGSKGTKVKVNPAGRFVIGGPVADCGLTGRKIIVDTYGGMARHGGGAFSGKDPSKVDRSAAYATRYIAKHLVAAGFASKCEIQVSYAIGVSEPVAIRLDTFGTEQIPHAKIKSLIAEYFDLTPSGIVRMLDLKRPIYANTAAYGHFGRKEQGFTWEALDKLADLQAAARKA